MASFESSQTCWVCWVELDKSTNGLDNFKLDGDRFATTEKQKRSLIGDFTFDSNFLLFLQVFLIFLKLCQNVFLE
jgi:hypothetical protein